MSTTVVDKKKIAKNTSFLYMRMGAVMLVQLYTSRVVLQALGAENYGIWSVVATLIVAINFLTNPLAASTQRFLNIELGKRNEKRAQQVFNTSIMLYAILGVVLLLLLESLGIWFLNNKMTIPEGSLGAANFVFQFSVFSTVISLLKIPYDAVIIANERFNFYAIMGIVDVALRLLIAFALPLARSGRVLYLYAELSFSIAVLVLLIYYIYCRRNYLSITRFSRNYDRQMIKEIASFSGWSTFGAFAVMTGNQGLNIVMNMFFGVIVNAAMGIANQVASSINQLVGNFQIAFQPQIVKTYAAGDSNALYKLMSFSSKTSFLLLFAISCPLIFNIDYILQLWLDKVPDYTNIFISLIIISSLIDAVGAPLWMIIQAVGKIKLYQILVSTSLLVTIIGSWLLFSEGALAPAALFVKVGVTLVCFAIRVTFTCRLVDFSWKSILNIMFIRPILMALCCAVPLWCLKLTNLSDIEYLIISCILFFTLYIFAALFILLRPGERQVIFNKFDEKFIRTKSANH